LKPEIYYREKQVLAQFAPVSRTTWWRWVRSGRAPRPIMISERVKVWRGSDLEAWQQAHGKTSRPASKASNV